MLAWVFFPIETPTKHTWSSQNKNAVFQKQRAEREEKVELHLSHVKHILLYIW